MRHCPFPTVDNSQIFTLCSAIHTRNAFAFSSVSVYSISGKRPSLTCHAIIYGLLRRLFAFLHMQFVEIHNMGRHVPLNVNLYMMSAK